MTTNDLHPARNPAAGTVPHGDPGKRAQRPSSGPGARERDVIPAATTGNAALDSDKEHAEKEHDDLYPPKRREKR